AAALDWVLHEPLAASCVKVLHLAGCGVEYKEPNKADEPATEDMLALMSHLPAEINKVLPAHAQVMDEQIWQEYNAGLSDLEAVRPSWDSPPRPWKLCWKATRVQAEDPDDDQIRSLDALDPTVPFWVLHFTAI